MRARSGCAVALSCLLIAALATAVDEQWDLVEETMSASSAPRWTPVARFPSLEACQARAVELSAAADATPKPSPPKPLSDGTRRLGFTCTPAASPERAPTQR